MLGEREFTTEEIAQFCGVSRPAVVEWITRGLLPARLTEGGHRRVARPALAQFLATHGYRMPVEVARERPLVFVINGDPLWRDTIQSRLEPDFEVRSFSPDPGALLVCGEQRPDVILFDMYMPGMSGLQLLKAFTTAGMLRDSLFIALTAYDEEVASARRYGAHHAIPRARVASDLYTVLVKLVSKAQRRLAAHEAS